MTTTHKRLVPLALTLFFALLSTFNVSAQDAGAAYKLEGSSSGMQTARVQDDGVTNEQLLKNYVQQRFDESLGIQPAGRRAIKARSSLTGNNPAIYDYLSEKIKQIAAGTLNSAIFSIPIDELCEKTTFTKADLGVEHIMYMGQPTDEAKNAAIAQLVDFNAIVRALMSDYPYELYWFDKEVGQSWNYGFYCDTESITITALNFAMFVSADYSETGIKGTTDVKDVAAAVTTAINNAKSIVADNATKTPLERMTAYKDAICDMTSYNTPAATSSTMPYGDPWQLVWVFDGDADTKVVCEGYSKAFKYLCDLSNFEGIDCLLVTGMMSGGSGSGSHMWNLVRMDDGRSYLVDVTNCDAGTIGYPDKLFMAYGPSGSATTAYYFSSPSITYAYYTDVLAVFTESVLTISPTVYAPSVTLNVAGDIAEQLNSYRGKPANITYERTGLTASKPVTVCLPYAYERKNSDGKYYNFTGVAKVDGKWTATMSEYTGTHLAANKPYLLVPSGTSVDFGGQTTIASSLAPSSASSSDGKWAFCGVYKTKSWSAQGNDYGFAAADGVSTDAITPVKAGDFVRADNGASVAPMRCYLTYKGAGSTHRSGDEALPESIRVMLVSAAGDVTAIDETISVTDNESAVYYDLQGRRVSQPTQGLYIVNGKKVVIK